jgi:hypothetical protein
MPSSSPRKKANRQNALKSTGPRSAAGKAVSSANATQHGILSRHLILPGESRAEFDALLQQLMREQQPVGTLEQALVERMAVALWRQRRLVAAETAQAQLRQGELSFGDLVRVKQITGVKDEAWIEALAREPLPDLDDLQAEVEECEAWLQEAGDAPVHDWLDLEQRFPRLWTSLASELEVDSPEEAAGRARRGWDGLGHQGGVAALQQSPVAQGRDGLAAAAAVGAVAPAGGCARPLPVQPGQRHVQGHARPARGPAPPHGAGCADRAARDAPAGVSRRMGRNPHIGGGNGTLPAPAEIPAMKL